MSHITPTSGRSGSIPGLVVLAVALSWGADSVFAQTAVYVVRHAEKVTDSDATDPPLTAAGTARAQALAKTLRSVKLSAVYATEYRRTQLTVEPTARARKIKPTLVKATNTKQLAAHLKERPRGDAVLVAGHSNTIPSLLRALGVAERVSIRETDYDGLFVVLLMEKGPPVFLRLHYGAFTERENE